MHAFELGHKIVCSVKLEVAIGAMLKMQHTEVTHLVAALTDLLR